MLATTLAGCQDDEPAARRPTPTTVGARAAACDSSRATAAGTSRVQLDSHGFAREYVQYTPASYTGRSRVPVVLEFHGYGSAASQQLLYGNFGPLSDRDGFLVVAPEGQGDPKHFTLVPETAGEQDDVQFVSDLLDHLDRTQCINRKRVYATGMSNGGAMSAVLACRLSERIAAFAAVAAVIWSGPQCAAARAVPIIAFHGTDDEVVPFEGGTVRCCGYPIIDGAPDIMANWARHNGCTPEPSEKPVQGSVSVRTWTGCKPGGVVQLYVVDGGGHTWPGAVRVGSLGATTNDVDASAVIWDFFRGKSL